MKRIDSIGVVLAFVQAAIAIVLAFRQDYAAAAYVMASATFCLVAATS